MMPRIFPTKILVDVSRHHTLSLASQDPVLLNTLLYATSAGIYAHTGDSKQQLSAMFFKGQAIHLLKQKLSNPDDESLGISIAYAVSLLLWSEVGPGWPHKVNAPADFKFLIVS